MILLFQLEVISGQRWPINYAEEGRSNNYFILCKNPNSRLVHEALVAEPSPWVMPLPKFITITPPPAIEHFPREPRSKWRDGRVDFQTQVHSSFLCTINYMISVGVPALRMHCQECQCLAEENPALSVCHQCIHSQNPWEFPWILFLKENYIIMRNTLFMRILF